MDIGGVDGMVHISELSWNHVNHPSEVVKVGDKVLFGKYSGQAVKIEGDEFLVMREDDIMGVLA